MYKTIFHSIGCAFVLLFLSFSTRAQNKYGQTRLCGYYGMVASFTDTSRPSIRITAANSIAGHFGNECSNICDSLTGKPLFYCNGESIFDTLGNFMDNGNYLIDSSIYNQPNFTPLHSTQGSIILPIGNNKYYVFATTFSDSMFQACWGTTNCPQGIIFDELRYHVVDMNLNGGSGKVVTKNKKLLNHIPLNRSQMMACRHANGKDWWLLKTGFDTNVIYTYRVTADSIYGPLIQHTMMTLSSSSDHAGQIAFGRDGTKYAAVLGTNSILLMADFDRCTGLLSHERYYHIPIDSTTLLNNPSWLFDSTSGGVCFSPNGQFVYISKPFNIYQFEYGEEDSSQAWFRVKHGPDTTYSWNYYWQLANAPDGRIYVGKNAGSYPTVSSVIDHPDIKGVGCGWCNRCFRDALGTNFYLAFSFANMPDYNLGPTNNPNCWPLANNELVGSDKELAIYPNPTDRMVHIKCRVGSLKKLYTHTGQLVLTSTLDELDVSQLAMGVYYVFVDGKAMKLVIE